jgi:hypothetical protein
LRSQAELIGAVVERLGSLAGVSENVRENGEGRSREPYSRGGVRLPSASDGDAGRELEDERPRALENRRAALPAKA